MLRERYIRSFDGTELYTTSTGVGPAVVLCDGLGCDGFIWRYIRPELAKRYRVIAWNYRGHGLSRPPIDLTQLDITALRRDLLAVMDAYQVGRAAVLGHSMGVQVLLDFTLTHPDRVWAAVPICGSYGRPLDTLHGDGRLARLFPLLEASLTRYPTFGQQAWRRVLMSRLTYAVAARFEVNGKVVLRDDFKPYFDHLASMDTNIFMRILRGLQAHSVEDSLCDIVAPTLVITAPHDTFTPMWLSLRMKTLIPGAELLVVPGGSHVAPIEIPELINLRLERFLEKHAGQAETGAAAALASSQGAV